MKLWAWAHSDPGRKRERNEDSYLVDPELGLLAVADGMGGHQGGATASRMAVDLVAKDLAAARPNLARFATSAAAVARMAVEDTGEVAVPTMPIRGGRKDAERASTPITGFEKTLIAPAPTAAPGAPVLELMRAVAMRASAAIFEASWDKPELRGMGTTLTAVLVHADRAHIVHAGDSRCYLFRDRQLRQLTDDHSWIAEQLRTGAISEAEAKSSKFRHVITKSIGFEREIDADLKALPVQPGDCFVLCSDGMSNYLEQTELERIVQTTWHRRLPETLVDLANQRGGDDNITVVVGLIADELTDPDAVATLQ